MRVPGGATLQGPEPGVLPVPRLGAWAVALLATALALLLRGALHAWLGSGLPFVTLFGAVALAVWWGGPGPALAAAIAGYAGAYLLYVAPAPWSAGEAVGLAGYAFSCGLIIAIGAGLRDTRDALAREVATRRAAEDAERSQRERLRIKLQSIADGVIATDREERITSMNPAAEALTGWSASEALGRPLREVCVALDEATREPAVQPLTRALWEGKPASVERPTLLVDRKGGEHPVDDRAAPIRDVHGEIVGAVVVLRDVSERRAAEAALRRAQAADARLASLVRHSHDAVISTSTRGRIETWNPAAQRILGWSAEEAIGRSVALYTPPEYRDEQREVMARVRAGETVSIETRRMTKAGELIDVLLRVSLMRDERGAIAGLAGWLQDITARKRAEAALRESLATLRVFYDNAPVMMGVVELAGDDDLRHLYDNPLACRLFGVEPGATAGRLASELGATRATRSLWIAHYLESARTGEPQSFDFSIDTRTQGRRFFSATVSPVGPGSLDGGMHYGYVCEDTTERQAAARRLADSEAAARLALQVAEAGTWRWRAASDAVEADARCREILGLDARAELRLADVLDRVHPADRERLEAALAGAAGGRRSGPYSLEFRCVHADASEHWVVARGQSVVAAGDGAAADGRRGPERDLLGTVFDITARRAAEDALRAADRRKDEFIATLAHELRNPLAPIRSAASLLQRMTRELGPARAPLAIIERQVGHMVRLIDDLMDLSRVSTDKLELRRERLDVGQVLQQAVETSRPLIEAAGQQLELRLPERPLAIEGDLTRLAQVLANLLHNAAKYTPAGGRIALSERAASVPGVVEIAVEDEGLGIPAEHLPRIFDMFTQVDRTLARAQGGLGIGLALARRLTEMHQGTLTATSAGAGQGSRFVVRLPLASDAAAPLPAPPPAAPSAASGDAVGHEAAPAGGRCILIADDNIDSADSLAQLLEMLGHRTAVARDGIEALEVGERLRPDVALLDIGMPKLDGYEVARRMRATDWGRRVMLLAVTGWGQQEDRRRSQEAGFDHHFVKPVDLAALEKLLA